MRVDIRIHFSQGGRREPWRVPPTPAAHHGVAEVIPRWKDFRTQAQGSPELGLRDDLSASDKTLFPFSQNDVFSPEPHHRSEERSGPVLGYKQQRIRQKRQGIKDIR